MKKFIKLKNISPGFTLANDLYGCEGKLLLRKGTCLTSRKITVLELHTDNILIPIESTVSIEDSKKKIHTDISKKITKVIDHLLLKTNEQLFEKEIEKLISDVVKNILMQEDVVVTLSNIQFVDDYTYNHSINVMLNAIILAKKLKLKRDKIEEVAISALLHDIGKLLIPKDIIEKPGKLSEDEYRLVKTHPYLGYSFLKENYNFKEDILLGVRDHHETIDGTGYCDGRDGSDIHLYAKLISVVDVYDALISDRPYRLAMNPSEVLEYMYGSSGHKFEYKIVKAFLESIVFFNVGDKVKLSNGLVGEIVQIKLPVSHRPIIKFGDGSIIDLLKNTTLVIERVLDRKEKIV